MKITLSLPDAQIDTLSSSLAFQCRVEDECSVGSFVCPFKDKDCNSITSEDWIELLKNNLDGRVGKVYNTNLFLVRNFRYENWMLVSEDLLGDMDFRYKLPFEGNEDLLGKKEPPELKNPPLKVGAMYIVWDSGSPYRDIAWCVDDESCGGGPYFSSTTRKNYRNTHYSSWVPYDGQSYKEACKMTNYRL